MSSNAWAEFSLRMKPIITGRREGGVVYVFYVNSLSPTSYGWGRVQICGYAPRRTIHSFAHKLTFHLARLDSTDSTRHIRRVEPMHFGCVELVKQHSSTRSTRRVRLARLARHVELDRRYLQLSYDHRNSSCLISYSLIN